MSRFAFLVCLALALAVAAGAGCVPFWQYHHVVKKNEDYVQLIDGHQKEHEHLARTTKEAAQKAETLEATNIMLKGLLEAADSAAKKAFRELQELLAEGVKESFGPEVAGGDIEITPDNKISIAGDVLFALGSADLTKKAKDILKKLAPTLKSKKFANAVIRIEGHTDDQPIKRPATLKNFPTNWHLSVGRAVSVLMELKQLGVPEKRMYAAGYGEFNPRVPNKPGKKGAAKNRRVEIAIMETK